MFWLSNEFQFHKGTIKTPLRRLHGKPVIIFQFHKGTIKTGKDASGDYNGD